MCKIDADAASCRVINAVQSLRVQADRRTSSGFLESLVFEFENLV
jgi:hypothetical protein